MKSKTRVLAVLLALTLCFAFVLSACGKDDSNNDGDTGTQGGSQGGTQEPANPGNDESITTINVHAFTDEVPHMLIRYTELFPDYGYTFNNTIIATEGGGYQTALDMALATGGNEAPDIYTAESAFVKKYTQGDMKNYAATYKELGIDVDKLIGEAQVAQYGVEIGTRGSDVVGLAFQATGGAMIYRRSIAIDTWGTDDPAQVKNKVGPGWDKFFEGAEELKEKGYAIVSGDGDIWNMVNNASDYGWIDDNGKLRIDPKREAFMDMSKRLKDNDYHNDTRDWQDAWNADMRGEGPKEVFAFFGPAWFINYCMPVGPTFGDWAIAEPPLGFFWGGTWVMGHKDCKVKKAVGEVIEWITLDSSDKGLQAYWAAGNLYEGAQHPDIKDNYDPEGITKDTVSSAVVMGRADGTLDFLAGQDMFDIFAPASALASGKNLTQYDETINDLFRDQVREYTAGSKTKEDAIADFKQRVQDELGVDPA